VPGLPSQKEKDNVRVFELLFIVAPTEADDVVEGIIDHLRGVAESQGATIAKVDKMGRRRLAYPIRRAPSTFNEGNYVVLTIEGTGKEIAELERRLRVAENVIRHMTVRVDEDLQRAEKFKAKRQAKGRTGGGRRRGRGQAIDTEVFTDAPEEAETPAAEEEA
jgi:small subunit ribosomal protein S6